MSGAVVGVWLSSERGAELNFKKAMCLLPRPGRRNDWATRRSWRLRANVRFITCYLGFTPSSGRTGWERDWSLLNPSGTSE